jgi:phage FluMu gp28-like protein
MGEKPVEDAQRVHGTARVEGVLMNGGVQLRLATLGKERFQDRSVRIPAGRPALRADLHKLRKEVGATGAPRFVADRDAAGHADRAWACFLGLGAADRPVAPIEFHSTGQGRASDRARAGFMAGLAG